MDAAAANGRLLGPRRRQQPLQPVPRERADEAVRLDHLAAGQPRRSDRPVPHVEGEDGLVEEDGAATAVDERLGRITDEGGEAHPRVADVGVVPPAQQPLLEDHEGRCGAHGAGGVVEGGENEQVPEPLHGARRLSPGLQPLEEGLALQPLAGLGAVRPPDAEDRRHDAELLPPPQVGYARKEGSRCRGAGSHGHAPRTPMRPSGCSTGTRSRPCRDVRSSTPRRSRKPMYALQQPRKTCWPLSTSWPVSGSRKEKALPPRNGRFSTSVTR